jgi:hypothetical protein
MRLLMKIIAALGVVALTSCGGEPTPTINGAMGTYSYQITPAGAETKIGTAITVQLRINGQRIPNDAEITVTGPSGWHPTPTTFTYPKNSDWVLSPEIEIAPVVGDYVVTAKFPLEGRSITSSATIKLIDSKSAMNTTKIALSNVSRTSVSGVWTNVPSASGYFARLYNGTDALYITKTIYTKEPSASFPISGFAIDLNPVKTNVFTVVTANFDTVADDPVLPVQVDFSDSAEFISLPTVAPARAQVFLNRGVPAVFAKP